MKKFFAILMAVVFLNCGFAFAAGFAVNDQCIDVPEYEDIEGAFISLLEVHGMENITVYDASELSWDILENRLGTTIVERCIGFVEDKENGDGIVLNAIDEDYNYISYRWVYAPYETGSVLLSYMVYDPDNEYVDGIMERYDFVLTDGDKHG